MSWLHINDRECLALRKEISLYLPSPTTLRETFGLLGRLGDGQTLDQLIALVDWQAASPQQVCFAVLGRLPRDLYYTGLAERPFEPGAYFRSLLMSAEFQTEILQNLLTAFPEKPRRFFVHVPRSGGTSLGDTLAARACTVQYNALGSDWCTGTAFLDSLATLCRAIPSHDSIHVIGHYTLRMIVDARLARFGDLVWTSLRPPQEIVLSFMNYILTVIESDPELTRPDTREWSRRLGLDSLPSMLGPDALRSLLPRMIREEGLLPRDLLCHFLGDGTAASAADLLAASDAEVIDSRKLDVWRERRWANSAQPWANVSRSFFKWRDLSEGERRQVNRLVRQDTILHGAAAASLGTRVSASGSEIALAARRLGIAREGEGAHGAATRLRRAARPVLLDPVFHRTSGSGLAWSDPPLDYQTIETTLLFPRIETRVRVRYRRRRLNAARQLPTGASLRDAARSVFAPILALSFVPGLGRLVGRFAGRVSGP